MASALDATDRAARARRTAPWAAWRRAGRPGQSSLRVRRVITRPHLSRDLSVDVGPWEPTDAVPHVAFFNLYRTRRVRRLRAEAGKEAASKYSAGMRASRGKAGRAVAKAAEEGSGESGGSRRGGGDAGRSASKGHGVSAHGPCGARTPDLWPVCREHTGTRRLPPQRHFSLQASNFKASPVASILADCPPCTSGTSSHLPPFASIHARHDLFLLLSHLSGNSGSYHWPRAHFQPSAYSLVLSSSEKYLGTAHCVDSGYLPRPCHAVSRSSPAPGYGCDTAVTD